ncbi:MAG: hypothetical protein KF744_06650 [Taibaiella sp.]|nr:hypothetical protein [Taibaiella sp.]
MRCLRPFSIFLAAITAVSASSCKKRVCYDTPQPPVHITDTVAVIDTATNPQLYAWRMAGTRKFAGTDSTGFFPLAGNADTSDYTIVVISDSAIKIETDTLYLQGYSFVTHSLSFKGITAFDSTTATYYHDADSIEYFLYSRPTLCCYTKKQKHTID